MPKASKNLTRSVGLATSKTLKTKAGVAGTAGFAFLSQGKGPFLSEILAEMPEKSVRTGGKARVGEAGPSVIITEKVAKPGKILESYGQVDIVHVKGQVLPLYRIKIPDISKEEQRLLSIVKEIAVEGISYEILTSPRFLR